MGTSPMAALVVMVLVLVSSTLVTAFDGYDGMPRPSGMDDQPTTTLGAKPAVKYNGKRADCTWYAWENFHYPPEETSNCSKLLWSALSQGADASTLEGFTYYAPFNQPEYYDRIYREYFCFVGCFNLAAKSGSGPSPAPGSSPPPEKAPVNAPPPASGTPAIAPASTPAVPPQSPARMAPPPPATLFRPPPPGLPRPPPSITSPPTGATTPGGEAQVPGPVPTQTSGGICALRLTPGSSLLIVMAAIFL